MSSSIKLLIRIIIVTLSFTTFLVFLSCDDGPINPKKNEHKIFRWEVDTISYPGSFQTNMNTIWGDSINDLWIAGHNNKGFGKAFYYDGENWKDFLPVHPTNFNTYSFNTSITVDDEVFLCGNAIYISNETIPQIRDSSLILSYKNTQWTISQLGKGGSIQSISGRKNSKLYAAGLNLTLFSYNGIYWEMINSNLDIPDIYETKNISGIHIDGNLNGYMSIFCYNGNPYVEKQYFAIEIDDNWMILDSVETSSENPRFGKKFLESTNGKVYSFNPGIFEYSGSRWFDIWNKNELITTMKTTNKGNIYAAGRGIYYYDGQNWNDYPQIYDKYGIAKDLLVFDNSIVVLFSNSTISYVVRGFKK